MFEKRFGKWLLGKPERRMPMAVAPLRAPGQALDEDRFDCLLHIAMLLMTPVALPFVLAWNLVMMAWEKPPVFWIAGAGINLVIWGLFSALPIWGLVRQVRKFRDLHLGLMAERLVGQTLESCRGALQFVFHDIPGEAGQRQFNIDHVAIGLAGVFVVETKGRSKPLKGETKITFDGKSLTFSGGVRTGDPVRQVEANARYVSELLTRLLSEKRNPVCRFDGRRKLPVTPVLVYPGWYVDFSAARDARTKVVNEKLLAGLVEPKRGSEMLDDREVKELGTLLLAHLRNERRGLVEV